MCNQQKSTELYIDIANSTATSFNQNLSFEIEFIDFWSFWKCSTWCEKESILDTDTHNNNRTVDEISRNECISIIMNYSQSFAPNKRQEKSKKSLKEIHKTKWTIRLSNDTAPGSHNRIDRFSFQSFFFLLQSFCLLVKLYARIDCARHFDVCNRLNRNETDGIDWQCQTEN